MTDWTKAVTQPLGLAGFALFLVFGAVARAKSNDERRWLAPVAVALAVVALVGCLFLSYQQTPKPESHPAESVQPPPPAQQQTNTSVQQTSTGNGSPNVQGVQGDVTITIDQSKGKRQTQKQTSKTPKPDSGSK